MYVGFCTTAYDFIAHKVLLHATHLRGVTYLNFILSNHEIEKDFVRTTIITRD